MSAKSLLKNAYNSEREEKYHDAKNYYEEIINHYPDTKEAKIAKMDLVEVNNKIAVVDNNSSTNVSEEGILGKVVVYDGATGNGKIRLNNGETADFSIDSWKSGDIIPEIGVQVRVLDDKCVEPCNPEENNSHQTTQNQSKVATCSKCNTQLVTKEKKKQASVAGVISVFLFMIGLGAFFVNIVVGILLMIFALIIGSVGRGTKTIMVCPHCGTVDRTI